jgi:Bacterial antitoxin of type II TA system, VapB
MRTTISLDDSLGRAARRRAREQGQSLSALVAQALRALLTERKPRAEDAPFRLVTVRGGGPQPGVDLDRTSTLIVADDETAPTH